MVPWVRAENPSVVRRSSVPLLWLAVNRLRSAPSMYRNGPIARTRARTVLKFVSA